jgi:hypothetical protein
MRTVFTTIILAILAFGARAASDEGLKFCNDGKESIHAALRFKNLDGQLRLMGHYAISPGKCVIPTKVPIVGPFWVFAYIDQNKVWSGKDRFCLPKSGPFVVSADVCDLSSARMEEKNLVPVDFIRVEIGSSRSAAIKFLSDRTIEVVHPYAVQGAVDAIAGRGAVGVYRGNVDPRNIPDRSGSALPPNIVEVKPPDPSPPKPKPVELPVHAPTCTPSYQCISIVATFGASVVYKNSCSQTVEVTFESLCNGHRILTESRSIPAGQTTQLEGPSQCSPIGGNTHIRRILKACQQ